MRFHTQTNQSDFLMGQKLKVRKVGPFHFT